MCSAVHGQERGTCVDNAYLYFYDSKNVEPKYETAADGVEMELIESFSMEEIAKLPKRFQHADTHVTLLCLFIFVLGILWYGPCRV